MKYKLILNDEQMHVIKDALELRMRIDLLQPGDLAEVLANIGQPDFSPKNPKHDEIFKSYIDKRDHISAVLDAAFEIAYPKAFRVSVPRKRDPDALECETMFDAIRHALWENNPDRYKMGFVVDAKNPMQWGKEPVPMIERVEE